ncbi:sigma-70 family RNA polymerase sigma factor [Paenibacillus sp. P25]|nr:sigma-70 family RNA polymerase sigma factor [Paenibacillus sp. P25]
MERPDPRPEEAANLSNRIEALIEQVRSGDDQAYAAIIRQFEKKIYTYCYCILKNREEAEDAVQEIFIKTYRELDRYRRRLSFSAWLYKIAYHHCLDQIRRRNRWKRLVSVCQERMPASYVSPHDQAVNDLLLHLNQEETHILLLKAVEQYSFEEMGQIMDCKPATLRKKYERLRKKLIEKNKAEGGIVRGEMV